MAEDKEDKEDNVKTAIELFILEIDSAVKSLNDKLNKASQNRDYDSVKDLADKGLKMKTFYERVLVLKEEWITLSSYIPKEEIPIKSTKTTRKFKKGLKTPQNAYRIPILQILVETKGGSASYNDVLKRVEELMKNKLNDYDKVKASPKSQDIRWINTAHWERHKMVKEGLLSDNSKRGIWEITEEGRKWLNEAIKKGVLPEWIRL
jgi:hypothetical protein